MRPNRNWLMTCAMVPVTVCLASAALGQETYDPSWYAAIGGGLAIPGDVDFIDDDLDNGPFVYGAIGKWTRHNNLRAELELSYRQHDFGSFVGIEGGPPVLAVSGDVDVTALMINLLYDFRSLETEQRAIHPYIGVGIGGAQVDVSGSGSGTPWSVDENEIVGAAQLMAGISGELRPNMRLDVGYRYFDTLGVDVNNGTTITDESFNAHILYAGLRFHFGAATPVEPPPPPVEPPALKEVSYKIYFPFDEYYLTDEAKDIVNEIATEFKDKRVVRILVQGNTDTSGTNSYNDRLSVQRSNSVRDGLIAAGVPAEWIVLESFGETNPAVDTGDGIKEPLNRRADIYITLE